MTFFDEFTSIDQKVIAETINTIEAHTVAQVLSKERLNFLDFLALLSPAAEFFLDDMAGKAQVITQKHFGRNIGLYAPLYLSNVCENSCLYCGFSATNKSPRKTLSPTELSAELQAIRRQGIRNLLLVSGESRGAVSVEALELSVAAARAENFFTSLEVYPLEIFEFQKVLEAGAVGLVVYQESYNPVIYDAVHPAGPKKNFRFRLETPDRALKAGFRKIAIGALLGLSDWRIEGAMIGKHAQYLMRNYWKSEVSIGFPRLRESAVGYQSSQPVADKHLVQLMLALRIFHPTIGLTISTRESAYFRDNILGLGVSMMSAGSKTSPGGYGNAAAKEEKQFEISDDRSIQEMTSMIKNRGFYPVFKDWNSELSGVAYENSR